MSRTDRVGSRIAHPTRNRLVVKALHILEGEFTSQDVSVYLLDHPVMIDQRFGYPAINRRLGQVAQMNFPRTPFPAGVVQGAVKFGIGIRFWSFSHPRTFYSICTALSSSIAALVGRILPAPGGNPRVNFKAVPLPEISAWIALLCEEGHASGSSLDAHFRKL
jgi:hypothetical protein